MFQTFFLNFSDPSDGQLQILKPYDHRLFYIKILYLKEI